MSELLLVEFFAALVHVLVGVVIWVMVFVFIPVALWLLLLEFLLSMLELL